MSISPDTPIDLQMHTTYSDGRWSAVEISAQWHGKMGDVLCFGFDPHDQALRAIADQVRQQAATNAQEDHEKLLFSWPSRSSAYQIPC